MERVRAMAVSNNTYQANIASTGTELARRRWARESLGLSVRDPNRRFWAVHSVTCRTLDEIKRAVGTSPTGLVTLISPPSLNDHHDRETNRSTVPSVDCGMPCSGSNCGTVVRERSPLV